LPDTFGPVSGGDGSFDEPSDAPGLAGMVDCVTSLLTAANARAAGLGATETAQKAILHASSIAEHLSASSRDELYGGQRGFRLGDRFLSMCYWTVGQHAQRAIDDLITGAVDTSEWAITLGATGLKPVTEIGVRLTTGGHPIAIQVAIDPELTDSARDELVTELAAALTAITNRVLGCTTVQTTTR